VKFDSYLFDALMRDLVGHSRSPSAYLVYLNLYRHSVALGRDSVRLSYGSLADQTGLSKRAVQSAVGYLEARQLVGIEKASATAIPIYTVLTPWRRISSPKP
jgi:hypothetical protein